MLFQLVIASKDQRCQRTFIFILLYLLVLLKNYAAGLFIFIVSQLKLQSDGKSFL